MIKDTFLAFLEYWGRAQFSTLEEQIEGWEAEYMQQWPELLEKQIGDYRKEGIDWKEIARERIFPNLTKRIPAITQAHVNLERVCEPVFRRAQQELGYDEEVVFVIYVGIGCGAGWATTYEGKPAVLFGLENIAECGWTDEETLTGLVSHELGHLIHFSWRGQRGLPLGEGAWWTLYSEGFAQRCEHLILGQASWHQTGYGGDWLEWCVANKSWLSARFLELAVNDQAVRPFFGSWYDIKGYRQTGYYLGHELVVELLKTHSLQEAALLGSIQNTCQPIISHFANPTIPTTPTS